MKKSNGKLNKIIALLLVVAIVLSPCDFSEIAYASEITLDEKVTLIETDTSEDSIVQLASATDSDTQYTYGDYIYKASTSGYTSADGETSYSYSGTRNMATQGAWKITSSGTYYAYGTQNTGDTHGIEISSDITVTLVLYNCNITTGEASPIYINSGAKVTIILLGENTMTATDLYAGIHVPSGATLTISGNGELKAYGGDAWTGANVSASYYSGAGIGGSGNSSDCGTITITGDVTVYAEGGDCETWGAYVRQNSAGIGGGGDAGNGGTITISGNAVVTAVAGDTDGASTAKADTIGSGGNNTDYSTTGNGTLTVLDNAIVIASTYPNTTSNTVQEGGIVVSGSTAYIYGDITFADDYTFPSSITSIVIMTDDEITITVEPGVEVDFNGILDDIIGAVEDEDAVVILEISSSDGEEDGKVTGYYGDVETEIDEDGNIIYPAGHFANPYEENITLNIALGNIFIGTYTSDGETYQRWYQSSDISAVVKTGDDGNSSFVLSAEDWFYIDGDYSITIYGTSEYSVADDGAETFANTITIVRGTHDIIFDNLKINAIENPPLEIGTFYDEDTDKVDVTLTLIGDNYLLAGGDQQAIYYGEKSLLTINAPTDGDYANNYLIATSAGDYVVTDSAGSSSTTAQMLKMTFLDVEQVTGSMITELTLVKYSDGNLQSAYDFSIKQENIADFAFKSIAITLPTTDDSKNEYYKVYAHGVEIYAVADADYLSNGEDYDYTTNGLYTSEFTTEENEIVKYWLATSMSEDEFKIIEGEYYRRINLEADILDMDYSVEDIAYDSAVTLILKSSTLQIREETDEESGNTIGYIDFNITGTIPAGTKMTIVTFGIYSQIQGCNYYTLDEDLTGTEENPATLSSQSFTDITGNVYDYNSSVDIKLVMDFSETTDTTDRGGFKVSLDAYETVETSEGSGIYEQQKTTISVSVDFKDQFFERTINAYLSDTSGNAITENLYTQTSTVDDSESNSYIVSGTVSFDIDITTSDTSLSLEDIGYIVVLEFAQFVSDNVQIDLSVNTTATSTLECAVFGTEVMINGFERTLASDGSYCISGGVITFYDMPAGDYMVTPKLVQKVSVYEKFGEELDWIWYYPETTDTSYCDPIYFTVVSPELVVSRTDDDSRIINASQEEQTLTFDIQKTDAEDTTVSVSQKTWATLDDSLEYAYQSLDGDSMWETSSQTDEYGIETAEITIPQGTTSGTYRIVFETNDAEVVYYNIIVE